MYRRYQNINFLQNIVFILKGEKIPNFILMGVKMKLVKIPNKSLNVLADYVWEQKNYAYF